MTYLHRRIFKTQFTGPSTLRELLQTMFLSELVQSRGHLWVVSPWISDVVMIDNRSGDFDSIGPGWGRREIRLSEVLAELMLRGSSLSVVTRPLDGNRACVNSLLRLSEEHGTSGDLGVIWRPELHTKGVVLSRSMLLGSMNLTYNGVQLNDEYVEYSIQAEDVAQTRLAFGSYLSEPT